MLDYLLRSLCFDPLSLSFLFPSRDHSSIALHVPFYHTFRELRGEKGEERGGEKRGLGVPIRPDLIPIGCPNLSRLRASIGKSDAGMVAVEKQEEEGEEEISASRRDGGEYPIDRDEGEENSRRNERTNERVYESFASFSREISPEKNVSILAFRVGFPLPR